MKHTVHTAVLAGLALVAVSNAEAYSTFSCGSGDAAWSSKSRTIYAYTGSFPAGGAYDTALKEAIARLNDNASGFTFNLQYTSTAPAMGNGVSEIWIENISPPGVTNVWWNGSCDLTEADVRMDSSVTWTTSTSKGNNLSYGGAARPFQTTLLHELGHAAGLGHEASEYNVMGQDWNHIHANGITSRAYLGEDASDGTVDLYGAGADQDLGVVHWRRTGASGEYSSHSRTRILDPGTGAELGFTVNGYGERVYNVNRGQEVRLEFSYENNGNSYQYQDVTYYVSTNDYISTWDTPLGDRSIGLVPDNVYTSGYTVTIPDDLSCNTDYWMGAIIDRDGSLAENNEWNNATYIPIHVNWNWWQCVTWVPYPWEIAVSIWDPRPPLTPVQPLQPATAVKLF